MRSTILTVLALFFAFLSTKSFAISHHHTLFSFYKSVQSSSVGPGPAHVRQGNCVATVQFKEESTDRCQLTNVGIILTIRYHFCFFLTYRVIVCRHTKRALQKSVRRSKRCVSRRLKPCENHPNQITCGVELVQRCTEGRFISDY